VQQVARRLWQRGEERNDVDAVVVETPVALVYNGLSHVVMMATPTDLEDLALGFSLSEGIIDAPQQLLDITLTAQDDGVEVNMEVTARAFAALRERRRNLTGRTGCGLCGLESLAQALPPPAAVTTDCRIPQAAVQRALGELQAAQALKQQTGGVHGAAWCDSVGSVQLVREDVGRHNALDKLLGALLREGPAGEGFVLVSSRASYEMVAKVASCNIPLLAAVSAPTSLAVQRAEASGLTLLGFVQQGRQVIYSGGQRVMRDE
jgi:FdhD protein